MSVVTGPESAGEQRQLRDVLKTLKDLLRPNPAIYWADLLATAAVGWSFFVACVALPWSWLTPIFAVFAVLALYRALLFMHELTHLRRGQAPGFHAAWNMLFGYPMMLPSVFYEGVHGDHHRPNTFGTDGDPEYLPLRGRRLAIVASCLSSLTPPLLLPLRFLIAGPLGLVCPTLQRILEERYSSCRVNPRLPPFGLPRRSPPHRARPNRRPAVLGHGRGVGGVAGPALANLRRLVRRMHRGVHPQRGAGPRRPPLPVRGQAGGPHRPAARLDRHSRGLVDGVVDADRDALPRPAPSRPRTAVPQSRRRVPALASRPAGRLRLPRLDQPASYFLPTGPLAAPPPSPRRARLEIANRSLAMSVLDHRRPVVPGRICPVKRIGPSLRRRLPLKCPAAASPLPMRPNVAHAPSDFSRFARQRRRGRVRPAVRPAAALDGRGPGARQPHRRTHRLQRRLRPADGHRPLCGGCGRPRGRPRQRRPAVQQPARPVGDRRGRAAVRAGRRTVGALRPGRRRRLPGGGPSPRPLRGRRRLRRSAGRRPVQ